MPQSKMQSEQLKPRRQLKAIVQILLFALKVTKDNFLFIWINLNFMQLILMTWGAGGGGGEIKNT
jgi:hypothetical protein